MIDQDNPTTDVPCPGKFIQDELTKRGWTQDDLARILGRPLPTVNRILKGKHAILPDMALALGLAFDTGPEIWMSREAAYRLSLADRPTDDVRRRARLYELAPIKDMEKRGWIRQTKNAGELEAELKKFFGVEILGEVPEIVAAMRRSGDENEPLSASQRAWCFRVRQLGSAILAGEYHEDRLPKCTQELRRIAAYPQEAHKVPQSLSKFGIRFVIVEPLPGAKVDGVALWVDQNSPMIGMSARFDRVDNFWFTLFHELSHIRHRDAPHLDSDLSGEQLLEVKSPIERRADAESADALIPKQEMDSFVQRVGPLYSKDRIVRFAHRIKIHPGIIVGQLQNRGEIGWGANREMLSKMRQFIVPAAVTDGWGSTIDPRSLS
jgi:HTH-type transcriptional regulator/antitoxin HigA